MKQQALMQTFFLLLFLFLMQPVTAMLTKSLLEQIIHQPLAIPFDQLCDSNQAQLINKIINNNQSTHDNLIINNAIKKPYPCNLCHSSFSRNSNLYAHKKICTIAGRNKKPHPCNSCTKSFSEKGTLTQHQRVHTGEHLYECDICLKKCLTTSILIKHQRIHTGEKPFKCEICHTTFSQNSNLSTHKKRRHAQQSHFSEINSDSLISTEEEKL